MSRAQDDALLIAALAETSLASDAKSRVKVSPDAIKSLREAFEKAETDLEDCTVSVRYSRQYRSDQALAKMSGKAAHSPHRHERFGREVTFQPEMGLCVIDPGLYIKPWRDVPDGILAQVAALLPGLLAEAAHHNVKASARLMRDIATALAEGADVRLSPAAGVSKPLIYDELNASEPIPSHEEQTSVSGISEEDEDEDSEEDETPDTLEALRLTEIPPFRMPL